LKKSFNPTESQFLFAREKKKFPDRLIDFCAQTNALQLTQKHTHTRILHILARTHTHIAFVPFQVYFCKGPLAFICFLAALASQDIEPFSLFSTFSFSHLTYPSLPLSLPLSLSPSLSLPLSLCCCNEKAKVLSLSGVVIGAFYSTEVLF